MCIVWWCKCGINFIKIGPKVLKLWCKTLFADGISDMLKTVYPPKTPFCRGYNYCDITNSLYCWQSLENVLQPVEPCHEKTCLIRSATSKVSNQWSLKPVKSQTSYPNLWSSSDTWLYACSSCCRYYTVHLCSKQQTIALIRCISTVWSVA